MIVKRSMFRFNEKKFCSYIIFLVNELVTICELRAITFLLVTIHIKVMQSEEILIKNERFGDFYAWIVSGSMLIYGYSLSMSASISPTQMMGYYRVSLEQTLMLTLFNAFFAAGGMFGSYLIEPFMLITSKRYFWCLFRKSFYISMINNNKNKKGNHLRKQLNLALF